MGQWSTIWYVAKKHGGEKVVFDTKDLMQIHLDWLQGEVLPTLTVVLGRIFAKFRNRLDGTKRVEELEDVGQVIFIYSPFEVIKFSVLLIKSLDIVLWVYEFLNFSDEVTASDEV